MEDIHFKTKYIPWK